MHTRCLPVAAFDLDGTLIRHHSLIRFAHRLGGLGGLVRGGYAGSVAVVEGKDRGQIKEAALRPILAGRAYDDVCEQGRAFARELAQAGLTGPTVEVFATHRSSRTRTVMVTAALDVYASPLGELLGFDAVLATQVDHTDRTCTGTLTDAGLTGQRKVDRLQQWLGPCADHTRLYAYGDSSDDEALLRYARSTRTAH